MIKTITHSHKNNIFRIKDLSVLYSEKKAVNEVTIDIKKNTITALIGPSGCGKSTFLRSINRMNDLIHTTHNEGEIIYEDIDVLDNKINIILLRKEIRSEEHTSELQSRFDLVCRLLLARTKAKL